MGAAAVAACMAMALAGGVRGAPAAPLRVTVTNRVLERHFLGFGAQWEYEGEHPELNTANPTWQRHWPVMLARVDFMRPSLLRVMDDASMYSRLEGGRVVPDYGSPRMEAVYRILDYARRRGITVVFGEWWLPPDYAKALGGIDSPRWADELVVPFLRYLRDKRGCTNIRYLNLMNEPAGQQTAPGVPVTFETRKTAILNLHAALKRAGLADAVGIVGTDGPGDFNGWIGRTARDAALRRCLGAYEYHLYAHLHTDRWVPSLLEGKLETGELRPRRLAVSANDPQGAGKPFFMGEAGIDDGNRGDNQVNRTAFEYGVWMADYAVQSMRAGQAGLIAWDMDDAMHTWGSYGASGLKGWGFWNSLGGWNGYPADDFAPRPWFATWSLLCRLFPRGSQTLAVTATGDAACRVAAARLPGGRRYSLVVVNEGTAARAVTVRMPGARRTDLREYRYFEADRPTDRRGFPIASRVHRRADLAHGLTVRLPGQGVVFLTTMAGP